MSDDDSEMAAINSYTSMFLNRRGKKIFCKYWESKEKDPRALVFIAHGFAEHCLPYDKLARTLATLNFFVFAHDHVGHGQSGGSRVHIDNFHHYVEDALQHIEMMKKKFPGSPIFLCGHSMGGAISILSALQKPNEFKGVALIAPGIFVNPELITPFKIKISRFLRWIVPHCPISSLEYSKACSCPEGLKQIKEDPLRWHGACKAGFGACLIDGMQEIGNSISSIEFPFLIVQGEDDFICDPKGATTMYEKAASKDKTLKMYPKAYHCLLFEPNGIAEEMTKDVVEWISARA